MKDLNLLFVFEALWHDHSVTLAAERLGLTQAAVSGSLKRLRAEYDDKLFVAVGRKMEPTPLATGLAPQLLDALTLVRKTRADRAVFEPQDAKRTFTVRTRDIGTAVCFPRILAALGEVAPGIRLRTVFVPIPETLAGMAGGRIDLSLGFLPALQTGIHSRLLTKQHYVCAMRENHPLANVPLTVERFSEAEHLLVEYSGSGHLVLERALIKAGARDRIRVSMPQYLAAPFFVTTSDMLWTVPAILANTLSKNFPMVLKPHPLPLPDFEVGLYWHERYHRDPANKWIRDFIAAEFAANIG